MSGSNDYLLFALSSRSSVSWQSFKELFDSLYLRYHAVAEVTPAIAWARWRTLRQLEALGHCDTQFIEGSGRVFVAPSLLARLPRRGRPQAIFCGSRGPQTLEAVKQAQRRYGWNITARVNDQERSSMFAPHRILVEADTPGLLAEFAGVLGIAYVDIPPAWQILEYAPALETYIQLREWQAAPEINWERSDFNSQTLSFFGTSAAETGIRLSRYTDPKRGISHYYWWKDGMRALVDLDWGRYGSVATRGTSGILFYDATNMRLAVPGTMPLPRLFARALVLCTGLTPARVEALPSSRSGAHYAGFDVYSSIHPIMAEQVATKLQLELTGTPIQF